MRALTLVELLVTIAIVAVLVTMILPTNYRRQKATRITCVNNLKQIGTAYRIWFGNQAGQFPAEQSVNLGGWKDILTNANLGYLTWTNYVLVSNELGGNTKLLVCPADERKPAKAFNVLSNVNLSYFVGVSATDTEPESIAGGDRNLGPGNMPANDYGFSPENGRGNDVALPITAKSNPICWSLKMHSDGNVAGAGIILLGDGSVRQVTSGNLCQNWLSKAWQTNSWLRERGQTDNWPTGFVPSSPSIRILFP
jgi:type II secretory pathway pseudopilin PulG